VWFVCSREGAAGGGNPGILWLLREDTEECLACCVSISTGNGDASASPT